MRHAVYIGIKNKKLNSEAKLDGNPAEMDEHTKKLVAETLLVSPERTTPLGLDRG